MAKKIQKMGQSVFKRKGRARSSGALISAGLLMIVYSMQSLTPCSAEEGPANLLREYYEKGSKAYQDGRYKQAIQYYEKVVEINPEFAPVYNALGLVYLRKNAQLSNIMWFFKEAVAIDPHYAPAYDNMCKIYYQLGDYDKAEEECLNALSSDPSLGQAQLNLAWIYLVGKSQPGQAIYYFNEVLKKTKKPKVYLGLGMAHSLKGDHAQVLDIVTILRGLGENEMAAQLESTLRPDGEPQLFTQFIPMPRGKPGQLVPSRPPAAKRAVEDEEDGLMRVRLRGKLTNTDSEPSSASPWSKDSPFLPQE